MKSYIGNEITYLLPGQLIITGEALKISTILGSCVSVCLFDPQTKISGMNHFLMPLRMDRGDNRFRFGDVSLDYMLNEIITMGAKKINLVSHVYGGSSMFVKSPFNFDIGAKNIAIAFEFLKIHNIPLQEISIGGDCGRKILFDTSVGNISCVFLNGHKIACS